MPTFPWHQLCTLREDVKSGTLTEAEFAADLYAVRTGSAPDVYRDPSMFFARTYPTYRMKELVRDVLQRLAGEGGSPVLRLQVAYGGGKTHSLITLLHLAERAGEVADNPTVKEFLSFSGVNGIPDARVALLPFDKLDLHHGLEVVAPNGDKRVVKTPWGALAYQLAGTLAMPESSSMKNPIPLLRRGFWKNCSKHRSPKGREHWCSWMRPSFTAAPR